MHTYTNNAFVLDEIKKGKFIFISVIKISFYTLG